MLSIIITAGKKFEIFQGLALIVKDFPGFSRPVDTMISEFERFHVVINAYIFHL
jgi:hypothetical protein